MKLEKLPKRLLYEKGPCKMLMKLTPGLNQGYTIKNCHRLFFAYKIGDIKIADIVVFFDHKVYLPTLTATTYFFKLCI